MQAPTVETLAVRPNSKSVSSGFDKQIACGFSPRPLRNTFLHERIVTRLAEATRKAAAASDQVRMLSGHHEEHGGGRRWFRKECRLWRTLASLPATIDFRLRSLCLLAAHCSVAKMDNALDAMAQDVEDEEEKDYYDCAGLERGGGEPCPSTSER
jgi:hypothetical protein